MHLLYIASLHSPCLTSDHFVPDSFFRYRTGTSLVSQTPCFAIQYVSYDYYTIARRVSLPAANHKNKIQSICPGVCLRFGVSGVFSPVLLPLLCNPDITEFYL